MVYTKLKLEEFERYVGNNTPTISYVGIRGDEGREVIFQLNQTFKLFSLSEKYLSMDVIYKVLHNDNIQQLSEIYKSICSVNLLAKALEITENRTKNFYYSKKLNDLLDLDVKIFNRAVFEFLKTTDYPVGKLDNFPCL